VATVAVWHGDKLLLIRHSYKPGDGLPSGTLRVGEPPVDAAARELYEEVGISASPDQLILLRSWKQKEGDRWLFEYRPPSMPRIVPDQREVVAAQFVARHELPNSIRVILGNNSER
jgi:ADP-ribose pyrophosphatase YjhB (NUDIX family)